MHPNEEVFVIRASTGVLLGTPVFITLMSTLPNPTSAHRAAAAEQARRQIALLKAQG